MNKKIKRVYYHFMMWEDYKNGMFEDGLDINSENKIKKSKELLSNPFEFKSILNKVLLEWKISTEFNLTNICSNRRAWLGAAACCYAFNATEKQTRIAWSRLNDKERKDANDVANKIIKKWESDYIIHIEKNKFIEQFLI